MERLALVAGWVVVVPVKHAARAKTRLVPPRSVHRIDLARAMAGDTLEAVAATVGGDRLLVVTSDPAATREARALGATVLPDPGRGLDAAVRAGAAEATAAWPGHPVAVLLADVPALRPVDLRRALLACEAHPGAVVPDAEGTGTVLLTARPGATLDPAFGPGSAQRHAGWAALLDLALPRLRRDVDDAGALELARALGVGPRTRAVLGEGDAHRDVG